MVSFMDKYHVSLHMPNERDYIHVWAREWRVIAGCQFWLFNWFVDFDVKKEPSLPLDLPSQFTINVVSDGLLPNSRNKVWKISGHK